MRSVFAKSLHDQRRSLIGCGGGTMLMVLLVAAIWPSISRLPSLDSLLVGHPEAVRKLFNLEEFGSGTGFVNAELFGAIVPVLFLAFAIAHGSRRKPVAATLATVGLAVEFGWLALAVGTVTGRRRAAIGVATATAVATYLLYVAGQRAEWSRRSAELPYKLS